MPARRLDRGRVRAAAAAALAAAAAALPAAALALAVAAHLQAQPGHDLQGAVRWLYALCRLRLAATLRRYSSDHGRDERCAEME